MTRPDYADFYSYVEALTFKAQNISLEKCFNDSLWENLNLTGFVYFLK